MAARDSPETFFEEAPREAMCEARVVKNKQAGRARGYSVEEEDVRERELEVGELNVNVEAEDVWERKLELQQSSTPALNAVPNNPGPLGIWRSHRRGLPAPPTASFTTILRGSVRWTKYNGSGHRLAIDTGFLRPQQRLSPPPTWICLLDQAQRLWTPPSSLNTLSTLPSPCQSRYLHTLTTHVATISEEDHRAVEGNHKTWFSTLCAND
ncbi:hypothetical protein DEU56DRAFT_985135 [Suillus clintonianus]|uniref:uncharacterized protein n=1 Tax=Suillus clintonianus TaxID=1904413 RepID=UPI001B869958|nr:uncharacterized protein DEU56DRAFT_985135 [Suillus clintonianus]KAG2114525.1 hypothetical protein DEU56DRAFT_985135 [Suillus clintonianus]